MMMTEKSPTLSANNAGGQNSFKTFEGQSQAPNNNHTPILQDDETKSNSNIIAYNEILNTGYDLSEYQRLKDDGFSDDAILSVLRRKESRGENVNGRFSEIPSFILSKERRGIIYYSVSASKLAEYMRKHNRFLIAQDHSTGCTIHYMYIDGCYRRLFEDDFKGYIKAAIAKFDPELILMKDIKEVFQNLTTDRENFVDIDALNADENIINFKNGVLHLDEMKLYPHSPEYLSTIQINCDWNESAQNCPVYDKYMESLIDGDKERQLFVEQFIGAVLSNIRGYSFKKAMFLIGEGNSGKTQIKRLVEKLLGKGNYSNADIGQIEARFGAAGLYQKRLSGSSDIGCLKVAELRIFKQLTGGDSINAEFKGKDSFQFTYNGFLWFCANERPMFGGDRGDWVYDRMVLIDCPNSIPEEKQDKNIGEKLFLEREAIVRRCILEFKKIIETRKFSIPTTSKQALSQYKAENSSVISFIQECVIKRPHPDVIEDDCTKQKMYLVYREWCKDNNNGHAEKKRDFEKELLRYFGYTSMELASKRTKVSTVYRFWTLKTEIKIDYQRVYGYDRSFTSQDN